jgi:hypothetical protein
MPNQSIATVKVSRYRYPCGAVSAGVAPLPTACPEHGDDCKAKYERNVLYRSGLGDFWFAPKVRVLGETTRLVVGRKYNVTDALQPYLLKKFRRKATR